MARPVKNTPEKWRELIMQAAQRLFTEKGFEATSVSDMMEIAGGAKGLFYRFFESKEELLAAMVNVWADNYTVMMREVLTSPAPSFEQKLDHVLTAIQGMTQQTDSMKEAFTPANFVFLTALTKRMTEILIPIFADILDAGIRQGALSIQEPLAYAQFIVHGALGMLNAGDGTPGENIANHIGQFREIVKNTLRLN